MVVAVVVDVVSDCVIVGDGAVVGGDGLGQ